MSQRMSRLLWAFGFACLLAGSTATGQESGKGQITAGVHEIEMKAGHFYSIRVEAKDFIPRVAMFPGRLPFGNSDFRNPNIYTSHYMSTKDDKQTLIILPEIFDLKGKGPYDYTYEVKAMQLAEKPIVDIKDELVNADPPFKQQFNQRAHHKSFELKVKAKQFYIIDMRDDGAASGLDHYLYLLDPKGMIVAQDDDGGGFPNARLVFQAPVDGDYRIITSGLGQALGKFHLTVKTTK